MREVSHVLQYVEPLKTGHLGAVSILMLLESTYIYPSRKNSINKR